MIKLYQFPTAWGLPNFSPFCMRLETYLRMVGLPYESVYVSNPRKAPKGKLPYIIDGDVRMGDSGLIIEYLKDRYGDPLDEKLSLSERATSHALDRMLNEHLYWAAFYSRWVDEAGWKVTKSAFFAQLPFPLRLFVPELVRKQLRQQLDGQGMGRHTKDEIYHLAIRDLISLRDYLADNPFMMGTMPTTIDATAYAYLANLVWGPHDSPLKDMVAGEPSLVRYCERMKQRYYGQ